MRLRPYLADWLGWFAWDTPVMTLEQLGNVRESCGMRKMAASTCSVVSRPAPIPPGRLNPILTGLFERKFLLGGGGVNLTPPSDLGPEGADRCEILHGCQDTCKEYCYNLFLAENGLFIMLLWFMQIRCIIITYLLIFPTNRISEGQFLAESYVEAL